MRPALIALSASGDIAAWVGAVGTILIGGLAALIAWIQFQHSRFRPNVEAMRDAQRRVLVRIDNEGTGAGNVQWVHLFLPDHRRPQVYQWELNGNLAPVGTQLTPFHIAGGDSVQLFVVPLPNVPLEGLNVKVEFGKNKDSGCLKIADVGGRLPGTTYIDKITNAVNTPVSRGTGIPRHLRTRRTR